jgi:hypothetical protein
MTQKTFERVRRIELQLGVAPSHYEPGQPQDGAAAAGVAQTGEAREPREEAVRL